MSRVLTPLLFVAFACLPSLLLAQPDGPIGQVHQELVGGTLTDPQTQQAFGLLTLSNPSGTCSASMLNDYWAITAAHCVFTSTTAVSAQFTPNQISLTANWPGMTKTVQALQIVAFSGFPFTPDDVALLQVSRHAFAGPVPRTRTLRAGRPMANLPIQAFGRGINLLASLTATGTIIPSSGDNKFRSAFFDIASINPNSSTPPQTYSYPGKNGAIVAGGDSGGPSYFQDFDNPSPRRKLEWQLIGVHSRCSTTCLAGQSCTGANVWRFVTSIQSCSDATILPIRDRILATIEQPPADDSPTGTFSTTIPDSVLKRKRALYAVNIDEPLIAPANAAIDIQLTFQQCHSALQINQTGCPLAPPFQVWSYDPATHRILHIPSGKCLNISGARRDPGAPPIILFQCVGAPNEKWTIIAPPNRSAWTIKSDLNNLCLTAIPGTRGGSNGKLLTLPKPGLLTQAACNGSTAQLFDDADANFAVRNGPH